jgi:spore coat polysaccharide biosynthesis protein SpsF
MLSNNFILIIQARYGSSRFRGKIMADICGKPLISRILQRVKKVKKIKKIIIATTKRKEDDILLDIAKQHKVEIFRGSENDLVDRYYKAVNKMNFKHILRLPADNALPEPSEYNRLINYHLSSKNDFSSNLINFMGNEYPDGIGIEMFTFKSLKKIWKYEKRKQYREHLSKNFYECANKIKNRKFNFKIGTIKCPKKIARPELLFDVNFKKDYLYIKKIYKNFYPKINFSTKDIIKWHDKNYPNGRN